MVMTTSDEKMRERPKLQSKRIVLSRVSDEEEKENLVETLHRLNVDHFPAYPRCLSEDRIYKSSPESVLQLIFCRNENDSSRETTRVTRENAVGYQLAVVDRLELDGIGSVVTFDGSSYLKEEYRGTDIMTRLGYKELVRMLLTHYGKPFLFRGGRKPLFVVSENQPGTYNMITKHFDPSKVFPSYATAPNGTLEEFPQDMKLIYSAFKSQWESSFPFPSIKGDIGMKEKIDKEFPFTVFFGEMTEKERENSHWDNHPSLHMKYFRKVNPHYKTGRFVFVVQPVDITTTLKIFTRVFARALRK